MACMDGWMDGHTELFNKAKVGIQQLPTRIVFSVRVNPIQTTAFLRMWLEIPNSDFQTP